METEQLLKDIIKIHTQTEESHQRDMQEFRKLYLQHNSHHEEDVARLQKLLADSENRIAETNAMISVLSDACKRMEDTFASQISHLQQSLDNALINSQRILIENERLLKENEAYYSAVKLERERYDSAIQTVISAYSRNQPTVKIDQR